MSYILDALRDSQQQREGGPVPGLLTEHRREAENAPAARATGLRVVWGVMLAVVIGGTAGWWFAVGDRAQDTQVESAVKSDSLTSPLPAAMAPGMEAADPAGASGQELSPTSPTVTVVDAGAAGSDSGDATGDLVAVESIDANDISTQPGSEDSLSDAEVVPASDSSLMRQMAEDLEARWVASEDVPATTQAEEVNDVQSDGQGTGVPVEPAQEPAPSMRQLPLEIQQQVDWIRFSVHLYASDPRRRLVKINGLVYREGNEVGNGTTIESITPTGAIFVYGDYRFSVPVQ